MISGNSGVVTTQLPSSFFYY